jgi:hypothetical protein
MVLAVVEMFLLVFPIGTDVEEEEVDVANNFNGGVSNPHGRGSRGGRGQGNHPPEDNENPSGQGYIRGGRREGLESRQPG